ncbi:hypothetical protein ENBRE01_1978, partial [Enteropsectra breve]
MRMFSLRLALIAVVHATISSKSRTRSKKKPSIFAYSNSILIDLPTVPLNLSSREYPPNILIEYSLEDDLFTEEEKMLKIKAQKEILMQNCATCKETIVTKLFPASMKLENIMGTLNYPFENEIVSTVDFHIKQCPRKCGIFHTKCCSFYCRLDTSRGRFCGCDTSWCFDCNTSLTTESTLKTAMKCLYKSTKPYEFAYIYTALKDYDCGDIRICLSQTDAPVLYAQKIKAKIEKCQFKGKDSMIASLDFFLLNHNSENKAAILGRFLRYSLSDSFMEKRISWRAIWNKCKDNNEIRQCIISAIDTVSEENSVKEGDFYTGMLHAYFINFNEFEILQLITKCVLSKQYYLLSCLKQISSQFLRNHLEFLTYLRKLPRALRILGILENNFKTTSGSILLNGCIDKKAKAIASFITTVASEQTAIYIYLKRFYKMQSKSEKSFSYKKEYMLFCESLISQLQANLSEPQNYRGFDSLKNGVEFLKICMFYSRRYGYAARESSFVARIFRQMDSDFKKDSRSAKKIEKCLTSDERREILTLRAMNCNSEYFLYEPTELLGKKTQKSLAKSVVNQGRSLMREGLQIMPQICKQFCTIKQYKHFLRDVRYSVELPNCILNKEVIGDLMEECKNIPRSETGFLPLHPKFYDLLDCENWQDNEVTMWCERNNFVKWLHSFPNVKFSGNNLVLKKHNKFIKRHFKMVLKYVLDKTENKICEEAELVAKCWLATVDCDKFYNESNLDIFNALAATKNGYFHANIFNLLKAEKIKAKIAYSVLDKICSHYNSEPVAEQEVSESQNEYVQKKKKRLTDNRFSKFYNDCAEKYEALELQNKYIKFVKKWEETDLMLTCVSLEMSVIIRSFIEKLEEIKASEVDALFNDSLKHATALNSIK